MSHGGEPLPSVCVVTSEIIGPPGSGGIGTAMTGLAEHLAAAGCRVSILYTGSLPAPDICLDPWKAHYATRGIELVALSIADLRGLSGPVRDHGFGTPYLVYQYLSARHFDVVHFNDYGGDGSLCLVARTLGLAFPESLLVVALHGPSEWARELNGVRPVTLLQSARDHAERLSVKHAGVLWSPSQYLLDWARQRAFEFPPHTIVRQYCLPSPPPFAPARASGPITEIVFFGRLESRKGLPLFCDSLDHLKSTLADRQISVTFLGPPGSCEGIDGVAYVAGRAKTWTFKVKAVTHLGQPQAIAYLRSAGRLAVMASPADNSPCTVYEAQSWGLPFLAARVGGIPELVHRDDHDRVLFDPTPEGLSGALERAMDHGACSSVPAVAQDDTGHQWLAFHANWRHYLTPVPRSQSTAQVVAIVDEGQGHELQQTLASLATIPAIDRVAVLRRDGHVGTPGSPPIGLPEAFAAAVQDHVLLIHAGTTVDADAFAHMLGAFTATEVDGLQPAGVVGRGRSRAIVPPLGGDLAFTRGEGATFTGGLLVRREALIRALEGCSVGCGATLSVLAERMVSHGRGIWPYPRPAFQRSSRWNAAQRPSGQAIWALRLIDLGFVPLVRLAASCRRRVWAIRAKWRVKCVDR